MKTILFWCLLFVSGSTVAQNCEFLTIDGVWLDPFDNQRINVLCNNASWEEIYSYPSWVMRDLDGNILAEEEVVYFGIFGPSLHFFILPNPWPDEQASTPVVMELWTGFGESLACSFEWEFVPRELEWTGTGDQGCFPVKIFANSNNADGCILDVDLVVEGDVNVWSGTLEMNESTNFTAMSDSLCLSQTECHELHLTGSPTSYLSVGLVDPMDDLAWNFQHWSYYFYSEVPMPLDTTLTIDFYGGDCDVAQGFSCLEGFPGVLYPNPVERGGLFSVPFLDGNHISMWDASGRRVEVIASHELQAPKESGLYYVVIQSATESKVYPLVVR
jgi:hypothetical protein